jgi:hypothetical protein
MIRFEKFSPVFYFTDMQKFAIQKCISEIFPVLKNFSMNLLPGLKIVQGKNPLRKRPARKPDRGSDHDGKETISVGWVRLLLNTFQRKEPVRSIKGLREEECSAFTCHISREVRLFRIPV